MCWLGWGEKRPNKHGLMFETLNVWRDPKQLCGKFDFFFGFSRCNPFNWNCLFIHWMGRLFTWVNNYPWKHWIRTKLAWLKLLALVGQNSGLKFQFGYLVGFSENLLSIILFIVFIILIISSMISYISLAIIGDIFYSNKFELELII